MKKTTFLLMLVLLALSVSALDLPIGVQKLNAYQSQLALSITFLIAFLGGILTFTSPCGFVLAPTFFAYIFKERKAAVFMTALFSLGMITAFMIFGIIAGLTGDFFNLYKEFFATISGILLIFFGIMLITNQGFAVMRFRMKEKPKGAVGVFLLGFTFAVGWTPCVGPILGGIAVLAAGTGTALKGALLFGTYALGIALPLMLVSYLSDKFDIAKYFTAKELEFSVAGKKITTTVYGVIAGLLLISLGLVMFFGKGTSLFMAKIPEYVPWNMEWYVSANNQMVAGSFFTSIWANIIGALIGLGVLIIVVLVIQKKYKGTA